MGHAVRADASGPYLDFYAAERNFFVLEKAAGKGQKGNWFQGLKSEFKKIVWVDRPTLVKQTVAVVIITVILAVIISVMDSAILEGINLLMK